MTQQEILSRMRAILTSVKRLSEDEADRISLDTLLEDDLALDSLDHIDLSLTTETTFNIRINMEKIKGIKTVGDWIAFITPLINTKKNG